MKTKLLKTAVKFRTNVRKSMPMVIGANLCMCLMLVNSVAFAAGASDLFTVIVKALGGIALAGAAIWAVMGAIAYGEAKTDGEGPEMKKAKNQIVGAIILAVVGGALAAGASQIGSLVSNISF